MFTLIKTKKTINEHVNLQYVGIDTSART